MTKDLAILVGNSQDWLETKSFLKELEDKLKKVMNNQFLIFSMA